MAINADRSNFYYFPTDCPHREKNGWTGDASMSADHMVLLYDVERSWRVWLENILKAQNDKGALPGIVPTAGWGFDWGNGPTWDSVIFNLPYTLYKFRGNTDVIRENAHAMMRYLAYILTQRGEDGTVAIGLGDWVPVGKKPYDFDAPLALTDSIMVMDIARKASEMFRAIGHDNDAEYAEKIFLEMRSTIRRELVDLETMKVKGDCQSSQCISLYYGIFEDDETSKAFEWLVKFIEEKNCTFDCGFIGMHTIFHVLSKFGRADLAFNMIMSNDYSGYGHLLEIGETSLSEAFMSDPRDAGSHNHHFLGDYIRWFIINVAGLEIIDNKTVRVAPAEIDGINSAQAWYDLPDGRVSLSWIRDENGNKIIDINVPDGVIVVE